MRRRRRRLVVRVPASRATVRSSLIHVASAGHAYRRETEQWATAAFYPHHTDEFRAATAEAALAHPHATFFVAGASPFVSSTADLLRRSGIADRQIRRDKYLFYKPSQPGDERHRS